MVAAGSRSLFGSYPPTPGGIDRDLWQFLLSLPMVFCSSRVYFRGALLALRARTLDMMVLVAVAIETADVVLMRSDPLDVATAISISRGSVRKMRQSLGWAIGYNSLALPIAAGVFEPFGLTLRPEIAAISMAGSSVLVAMNALCGAIEPGVQPRGHWPDFLALAGYAP